MLARMKTHAIPSLGSGAVGVVPLAALPEELLSGRDGTCEGRFGAVLARRPREGPRCERKGAAPPRRRRPRGLC
jgi:hypothetical protein